MHQSWHKNTDIISEFYIDFVMLLNSLLPHHDSKSNGLKSEIKRNEFARFEVFTPLSLGIQVFWNAMLFHWVRGSPQPLKMKKLGSFRASENTNPVTNITSQKAKTLRNKTALWCYQEVPEIPLPWLNHLPKFLFTTVPFEVGPFGIHTVTPVGFSWLEALLEVISLQRLHHVLWFSLDLLNALKTLPLEFQFHNWE